MTEQDEPDRDEPIKLPDDPEAVLRALMEVDPEDEPAGDDDAGGSARDES